LDGKAESYDKWEIQWNAFLEVESISSALGNTLDTKMTASSVTVVSTTDAQEKLQPAAIKANKKAMTYWALESKSMKLLRLLTKAKTVEWPEGEVWSERNLFKLVCKKGLKLIWRRETMTMEMSRQKMKLWILRMQKLWMQKRKQMMKICESILAHQIVKVHALNEVVMKMKRMMIKVGQPPQDQGGSLDLLLVIEMKWLLQQ